jgi:hypothetical protein
MIIGEDQHQPETDDDVEVTVRFMRDIERFAILDSDDETILESFSPVIAGRFISQRAKEIQENRSVVIFDAFGSNASANNGGIIIP